MSDIYGSIASTSPATATHPGTSVRQDLQPVSRPLAQVIGRFNDFARANPAATMMLVGGLVMVTVIALKPKARAETLDVRAQRKLRQMLSRGRRSSSSVARTLGDSLDTLASAMAISPGQVSALKERSEAWLQKNLSRRR